VTAGLLFLLCALSAGRADVTGGSATADERDKLPKTMQELSHQLDVVGLPDGMALVVAHDTDHIINLTVVTQDGRHSLDSWDRVPAQGVRSPRVWAVSEDTLRSWKVRARAALDAADEDPSPDGGHYEIPAPTPRVDCGIALRIHRSGPLHWPDEYLQTLTVVRANSTECVVERTEPDLPPRVAALSPTQMGIGVLSLLSGGLMMLISMRSRTKESEAPPPSRKPGPKVEPKAGPPPNRKPRTRKKPVRQAPRVRRVQDNDVEPPRDTDSGGPRRRR